MDESTSSRPVRPQEIRQAAIKLFRRRTYASVSLDQIAEFLSIGPSAIYHYFENKSQLIADCVLHSLDILEAELESAFARHPQPIEGLLDFLQVRLSNEAPPLTLFTDIGGLPEAPRQQISDRRIALVQRIAERIERGIADGFVRPCSPKIIAVGFISTVDWLPFWLPVRDDYLRHTLGESLLDLVRLGAANRERPEIELPGPPNSEILRDKFSNWGKRRKKHERMLEIASRQFNSRGVLGTSLAGLAAELGIRRETLYYHFSGKDELLDKCLRRGLEYEYLIWEAIDAEKFSGTGVEIQSLRLHFEFHETPLGPQSNYHNISYVNGDSRKEFMGKVRESIDLDRQRYRELIRTGDFREVDTLVLQRTRSGLVNWYAAWANFLSDFHPHEIADQYGLFLYYGLTPLEAK